MLKKIGTYVKITNRCLVVRHDKENSTSEGGGETVCGRENQSSGTIEKKRDDDIKPHIN